VLVGWVVLIDSRYIGRLWHAEPSHNLRMWQCRRFTSLLEATFQACRKLRYAIGQGDITLCEEAVLAAP